MYDTMTQWRIWRFWRNWRIIYIDYNFILQLLTTAELERGLFLD